MPEPTPPLSARVANLLEDLATRIREMTVDRVAVGVTWAAIAIVLLTAICMAVFWLLVGIFRALGTLMGVEVAYAVVGLLLVVGGAILWIRRYPQDRNNQESS